MPRPRKRRQAGGDQDGGNILELHVRPLRKGDTHVAQHVDDALLGEWGLRGLVSAAVKTDHQTIANELVLAHTCDARKILDALGRGLGCGSEKEAGRDDYKQGTHQQGLESDHA